MRLGLLKKDIWTTALESRILKHMLSYDKLGTDIFSPHRCVDSWRKRLHIKTEWIQQITTVLQGTRHTRRRSRAEMQSMRTSMRRWGSTGQEWQWQGNRLSILCNLDLRHRRSFKGDVIKCSVHLTVINEFIIIIHLNPKWMLKQK